ncbi:ABC-2 type transport system permease protein [Tamaricihabitans halophyticus]|uniref:ABC-2 type transport system permease protein n=1 Tax=Tamaricihabitans halophyticus TaxID=1262583 RepID=A0A4R2QXM5_9PSEU|nr:ABC transporter permease [Tamaricihabitans halophyticus]TCP54942.1 ABC-2 type transport system permease protein [Tamaricihabitans halophyticus]
MSTAVLQRVSLGRVLRAEIADELRGIVREPTALFFSILMPVGFFALFVSIFGDLTDGTMPAGTRMVATFGTFGVLAATMLNPGIGIAQDREIGWLRAKRVSAVPVLITLLCKVVAALCYAIAMLVAMAVTAGLTGSLEATAGQLLRLAVVLLLGAAPFALLGIAIGLQAGSNATAAILNAVLMPSAVVSGLWMPLEILPDFFGHIAQFLPTYHLSQLAIAQLDGGPVLGHALVMLGSTAALAAAAALSYRHARP